MNIIEKHAPKAAKSIISGFDCRKKAKSMPVTNTNDMPYKTPKNMVKSVLEQQAYTERPTKPAAVIANISKTLCGLYSEVIWERM